MLASAEDTSVLSPRSRMNQAQQELSRVVQALVHIGEQFNQAIVDSANEVTVYKSRITELECRNHEIHSTASEAAFRKLQHVKCVMRTLLEEIGSDDDGVSDQPPPSSKSPTRARPPSDPGRGFDCRRVASCSGSPSSQARLHGNTPQLADFGSLFSSTPVSRTTPRLHVEPSSSSSPGRSPSQRMSPWRLFKPSTLGEDMDWRMATNRTPKCAEIVCPIPWAWLPQRLGLDEDAVCSLESLSQMDNFCFRVQIINEMAFVYEPFSLDCSSASLILDWGALEENLTTARYIASKMKGHPFFHTFILPTKKDVWYYIGAQAWTLTRLFPIWKTLGDRSKQKVVSRLEVRCCQKLSTQDICQMLDDRVLAQFCVEVSSTSLLAHSQAFGEKLDYRKST